MRRALVLLCLLAPAHASADAVDPEPWLCPPGTEPYSDHGGPGCRPDPPDDCPDGFAPRVADETAYCEPPPAEPCPTGSFEASFGPDRPYCRLGRECELGQPGSCWSGSTCRPARLCASEYAFERFGDMRSYGPCETDADCDEGRRCRDTPRCDPDVHRFDPDGRARSAIVDRSATAKLAACGLACLAVALGLAGVAVVLLVRRRRGAARG